MKYPSNVWLWLVYNRMPNNGHNPSRRDQNPLHGKIYNNIIIIITIVADINIVALWCGVSESIARKNAWELSFSFIHSLSLLTLWRFGTQDVDKIVMDYRKLRMPPYHILPQQQSHSKNANRLYNVSIRHTKYVCVWVSSTFRTIFITPKITSSSCLINIPFFSCVFTRCEWSNIHIYSLRPNPEEHDCQMK